MIPRLCSDNAQTVRTGITALLISAMAAMLTSCAYAPAAATNPAKTRAASELSVKKGKQVSGQSWIGIRVEDLLDEPRGPAITRVVPGGPADRAGLKMLDVIGKFGGYRVADADTLADRVRASVPGQMVPLEIYRNGRRLCAELIVAEKP
jgi:S1-C subfamily serine protease